jgi:hypothetical protein
VCGAFARLDQTSRFLIACPLSLLLWFALLYWDILFSGYLFLFSTIAIFAGWRLLSAAILPALALEKSRDAVFCGRRQTIVSLAIMIVTAIAIDAVMSTGLEDEDAHATVSAGKAARSE